MKPTDLGTRTAAKVLDCGVGRQRHGNGAAFARVGFQVVCVIILIIAMALLPLARGAKKRAKQFRLLGAAERGDLAMVKSLLEEGVAINCTNEMHFGFTPLMGATFHYQTNVICYLVEKGADVNVADRFGETPLMQLMGWGDEAVPMVKLLIEHGARLDAKDNHGATVFSYAQSAPPKPQLIQALEAAQKTKAESRKP